MQCQVCQQSLRGERGHGESSEPGEISYNHHKSAIDIRTAAREGCHLCAVFWNLLSSDDISRILGHHQHLRGDLTRRDQVQISALVREATPGDAGEMTLRIAFPLDYPDRDDWYGRFYVKHLGLVPVQETEQLEHDHEIAHNTASDSNFALAKTWVDTCVSTHTRCSKNSSMGELWFPTRLIEINDKDPDSEARIIISSSHLSMGPYMTLSHCWGSAQFPNLTKSNLESMKKSITVFDLPNTFRHAIQITRRLGMRYLWIDALCIVQDSLEDWRREAATMGNVYKYAFCNIAATGAADSTVGCFWDRNPLLVRRCKIDISWDLPPTGSFYCEDRSLWTRNVGEAPLNRRAWVAQERMLSPRILHFGSQQLFWECHEQEACESYPRGIPRSPDPMTFIVRTGLKRLKPSENRRAQEGMSSSRSEYESDALEYWDGIVDLYTRSSLTMEEDKLIAISGVAKEMQFILDDVYLAGLWKKQLPGQLLWSINRLPIADNGRPATRPRIYVAPSWSWASIVGAVVPGNIRKSDGWDLLPTYLDASIDPLGNDLTAEVTAGRIQVRGFLKPATWEGTGGYYELLPCGERTDSNNFWPDEIPSSLPGKVFCFPLLSKFWDETRFIDGLVLASTENQDEFRRVGKFRAQDEDNCRLFLKHKLTMSSPRTVVFSDLEEQNFTIV